MKNYSLVLLLILFALIVKSQTPQQCYKIEKISNVSKAIISNVVITDSVIEIGHYKYLIASTINVEFDTIAGLTTRSMWAIDKTIKHVACYINIICKPHSDVTLVAVLYDDYEMLFYLQDKNVNK